MKSLYFLGALLYLVFFTVAETEARHHCRTSFSINFMQPTPVHYYEPVPVYYAPVYAQPVIVQQPVVYYPRARPAFAPAPCARLSWYF